MLFGRGRWGVVLFVIGLVVSTSEIHAASRRPMKLRRLGVFGSSFNAPLQTPADLPQMLRDKWADVQAVLAHDGTSWTGNFADLELATSAAPVREITIAPGEKIPWMAMRRRGVPSISNPPEGMVWAGAAPLEAYTLTFESNGREWTLTAPKPCGNFWVTSSEIQVSCTPTTCAAEGATCGTFPDGCGRTLYCGPPCTVAECFREDQEIQFAPAGSPHGRDGLIMHDNGDFGDTAQREGWYWLGVWLRQNKFNQPWADIPPRQLSFDDVLRKLEPNGDGVFVRAPGKDPFGRPTDGHDNHGTTRDQLVPLIAAMSVWGKREELQRLWNALPEDVLGKHDFQGHWRDLTRIIHEPSAEGHREVVFGLPSGD